MTDTVSRVPVQIPARKGDDGLKVTDAAVRKVSEFTAAAEGDPALRVAVKPGGCSGLSYSMYLDSDVSEKDLTIEREGVRIVVDPASLPYLKGTTLDYQEGLMESGFTFDNPNATSSCGCGSSFS